MAHFRLWPGYQERRLQAQAVEPGGYCKGQTTRALAVEPVVQRVQPAVRLFFLPPRSTATARSRKETEAGMYWRKPAKRSLEYEWLMYRREFHLVHEPDGHVPSAISTSTGRPR